MIQAILKSVEFSVFDDQKALQHSDPLEHFRLSGSNKYDFSKLADEIQFQYGCELTLEDLKDMFG